LPDVPPMSDFVPGDETGSWFEIGTPKHMPDSVVSRFNIAVHTRLSDPRIKASLAGGAAAAPRSPTEFASFIPSERERFAKVLRRANIKAG
jgi:tripartite-type tricarboxylate transporter receptor subunit TctC